MTVLTQFSYTSAKKFRTASSVAGLVGLYAILLLFDVRLSAFDEGGMGVRCVLCVAVGSGQCSKRKRAPDPVRKHEMKLL